MFTLNLDHLFFFFRVRQHQSLCCGLNRSGLVLDLGLVIIKWAEWGQGRKNEKVFVSINCQVPCKYLLIWISPRYTERGGDVLVRWSQLPIPSRSSSCHYWLCLVHSLGCSFSMGGVIVSQRQMSKHPPLMLVLLVTGLFPFLLCVLLVWSCE